MSKRPKLQLSDKSIETLSDYTIRVGDDGKVGIYLRKYNVRSAVFDSNSSHLQVALREVFVCIGEKKDPDVLRAKHDAKVKVGTATRQVFCRCPEPSRVRYSSRCSKCDMEIDR